MILPSIYLSPFRRIPSLPLFLPSIRLLSLLYFTLLYSCPFFFLRPSFAPLLLSLNPSISLFSSILEPTSWSLFMKLRKESFSPCYSPSAMPTDPHSLRPNQLVITATSPFFPVIFFRPRTHRTRLPPTCSIAPSPQAFLYVYNS